MSNDNNNAASALRHFASLLIIPVLFVAFYALRASAEGFVIEQWLSQWDIFVILGVIMVVERLYTYRYATNTFVSHPIDYALRNVMVFTLLGVVGFYPLALLIALPAANVPGIFSHCGGDVKGGALNKWFVTPEVHRWHHSAVVPEGHRYSCNYGVEVSFWDRLFGTFYLPVKNGQTEQPEHVGHPDGLADERNYIKLLLAPLGLYPVRWLNRFAGRQRAR